MDGMPAKQLQGWYSIQPLQIQVQLLSYNLLSLKLCNISIWVRYNQDFYNIYRNLFPSLGPNNGACIHLQRELETPLLWFACRHHVGEIILTHVWESLRIEASKSPEVSIFKR